MKPSTASILFSTLLVPSIVFAGQPNSSERIHQSTSVAPKESAEKSASEKSSTEANVASAKGESSEQNDAQARAQLGTETASDDSKLTPNTSRHGRSLMTRTRVKHDMSGL